MDYTPEFLARAHYWMRFARAFDDRLQNIFKQGKIVGGLFSRLLISVYLMPVLYAMSARDDDHLEV